jgi:hypothetical protein
MIDTTEIQEISEYVASHYDHDQPEEMMSRLTILSSFLARTATLLPEADELLSIRKGEAAQKHLSETATVMRYLIDSETSTEARLCKHLDRLNSAIVHQIDAIRTQISYHKAQRNG